MKPVYSKIGQAFLDRSAEQLLFGGVIVAVAFFVLLFAASSHEDVIFIEGGVGLLQNYGLFAALLGDAVLFFLTKKYLDSALALSERVRASSKCPDKTNMIDILRAAAFETEHRFVAYIFMLIGALLLTSNVAIHVLGDPGEHWSGDVFDSYAHTVSFYTNKAFLIYSWMFVIPFSAYFAVLATVSIWQSADAILNSEESKYDLLHSDNSGGFAEFRYANVYLNFGLAILYLQISLYTFTFKGANPEHILGYIAASLALVFANLFIFKRVEDVIQAKKLEALETTKDKAYRGDQLHFEIFRYYLDDFSKKSLRRRLSVLIFSVKSIAIAIPPALKGALLLTSSI